LDYAARAKAQSEAAPGTGAEAWISIGVGLFLLLIQPRFALWLSSRLFHTHFNEFIDQNGTVVPYTQVPEFWSDLGPFLFALVLIFDGVVIAFVRRRAAIAFVLLLTVVTTLFNLIWLVASFAKYGLALISFLAVVFGAYTAFVQWKLLQSARE
jgi:hypothetical protein